MLNSKERLLKALDEGLNSDFPVVIPYPLTFFCEIAGMS